MRAPRPKWDERVALHADKANRIGERRRAERVAAARAARPPRPTKEELALVREQKRQASRLMLARELRRHPPVVKPSKDAKLELAAQNFQANARAARAFEIEHLTSFPYMLRIEDSHG